MLLVFVLTGLATYGIGRRATASQECYRTAARVTLPDRPGLSAETLRHQILSDPLLASAAKTVEAAGKAKEATKPCPDLDITAERGLSGQWEVTIAYHAREASQAIQVVNTLATHLAESVPAESPAQPAPSPLPHAADAAQLDMRKARVELDQFVQQHFAELEQRADRLRRGEPSASPLATPDPAPAQNTSPSQVENPRWSELNDQIARLEQQRAELLQSRTPMHPSVKDLEAELARLEQQLQQIPRQTPAGKVAGSSRPGEAVAQKPGRNEAKPLAAEPSPGIDLQPILREDARAAGRYSELRLAADLAEQRYEQLLQAEPQARPSPAPAPVHLKLAERGEPVDHARGPQHLVLWALLAGLAMATGASLFAQGLVEPPLSNLAEARAALPVPVIGIISASGSDSPRAVSPAPSRLVRWALLLGGAALMVVCLGLVSLLWRG